jgi:uncharacterized protein YcbK (DUF882 family)
VKERAGKASASAKGAKKLSRYAAVELYQINTKETLKLRFQDDKGRPIKGWQKRFDKFMRCHQTGAVHKMDARLAHLLYQTARHFEGRRMEVVSGYRHPKVARNPKSPHKLGLACDFRMAGIANTVLRDYLRKAYDHVGVGYYPNSVFVHLDNRKTGPSAFWIDYSGPGQAAEYSENAWEDLRSGRADHRKPREEGSEGEDDMAQAGLAGSHSNSGTASAGAASPASRPPMEVKPGPDPFGD